MTFGTLTFALPQTLVPLLEAGSQVGSVLTQTYVITNRRWALRSPRR
jgi:hypothetical protein